jgi:superfamily II DNA or RNA helicase
LIISFQKFGGRSRTSLIHNDVEIVENVKEFFDQFDTVIVDEAHHYPARTWLAIGKYFEKKKMVFLTATPYHRGNPILSNQCIVFELKRSEIEGIFQVNIQ